MIGLSARVTSLLAPPRHSFDCKPHTSDRTERRRRLFLGLRRLRPSPVIGRVSLSCHFVSVPFSVVFSGHVAHVIEPPVDLGPKATSGNHVALTPTYSLASCILEPMLGGLMKMARGPSNSAEFCAAIHCLISTRPGQSARAMLLRMALLSSAIFTVPSIFALPSLLPCDYQSAVLNESWNPASRRVAWRIVKTEEREKTVFLCAGRGGPRTPGLLERSHANRVGRMIWHRRA